MDLSFLVRKNIQEITPYSSARDEFESTADVYLDANENPFENGVNRYPDPHHKNLLTRIAALKNIARENVILGNGSDEILDLVFRCFCNPGKDNIITTPPTYGMYKVLAKLNDVVCKEVLMTEDFSLDIEAILQAANENTKIIILCSPNNPSGNLLPASQVETLLERFKGIVLLDEAYIDFAGDFSFATRLMEFPNLFICQTLSKAWGMAGLRIGIGIASKEIIGFLQKIKPPYNINCLSLQKAEVLIQERQDFDTRLKLLLSERNRLKEALPAFSFVRKIYPSDANFLLVQFADADTMYQYLVDKGVVVRNRSTQPLCDNCLRITVGLPAENDMLLTALKNYKLEESTFY